MANCTTSIQQHFAFDTINTDVTGPVVADQANDTLTMTSADGSVTITGTAGTDTIDFAVAAGTLGEEYIPLYSGARLTF